MARLKFGAFLAPHHPIGEHPMLAIPPRPSISSNRSTRSASNEFCAASTIPRAGDDRLAGNVSWPPAGERTKRIRLGTGVVSLPYHHPFNVAQRMVQLDYMTGGRAIFGSGPARWRRMRTRSAIDPMTQRDRQDEAIAIIRRLFKGERVTAKSDWFTMNDAALAAVAAAGRDAVRGGVADLAIGHDAGRQIRHRHHFARLDVDAGPDGAADAMGIRRGRRQEGRHHREPFRWRVLLSWHIAETREQARREAGAGRCLAQI